jgi:glutamyl-tRNA synthetase
MAARALAEADVVLRDVKDFNHAGLDPALRAGAERLQIKAGQMFQPIRVAVCGRKDAPPLFETLEVLGRETALKRIDHARQLLRNSE